MKDLNEKIQKAYMNTLKEEQDEKMNEAKLTRQHFIALAGMMKTAKTLELFKEDLLTWLKGTNPMFDEIRFRKAAGM
jgi:hypothetical protein